MGDLKRVRFESLSQPKSPVSEDDRQTLAAFSLPGGGSGAVGLQVLPAAMTLAGVNIPAGSLLVTNGGASFDKVYAVNPANRSKKGTPFFKFTFGRTIKKGDDFKTAYAFRFADIRKLIDLLEQGRHLVVKAEHERTVTSPEEERE